MKAANQLDTSGDTQVEVVHVTPKLASEMLSRNSRNRPLSATRVNALALAMREGRFSFNGDSIRFGTDGVLLDGQHRLAAIVASGVSQMQCVIRGLNPKVFATIDQSAKRTGSDVISMMGGKNTHRVSSTLQFMLAYERGDISTAGWNRVPPDVIQQEYPRRADALARAVGCVGTGMTTAVGRFGSVLAGIYCLVERDHREDIEAFVNDLTLGIGLSAGDPALLLRERLIADAAQPRARLMPGYAAAIIVKAWNAYAAGLKVGVLRMHPSETFPVIRGA